MLPDGLRRKLAGVRSMGAITGAGVSSESGIPTYRGQGGLYDDPAEGDRTQKALTGSTLLRDPDRTWRAVAGLARLSTDAHPNAGHEALVSMEQRTESFVLLTQNVDGLHQAAGSRNVIDIHGHVFDTLCMGCGARGNLEREILPTLEAAPACPSCGGTLRPDVVLFEEMLPVDKLARIQKEFYDSVPDLVLAAGTTALFPYIAEPVLFARRSGKLTIEVNPEPTVLSDAVDFSLRGPAGEFLPQIAAEL
ncbi:MAG: NAD-dependent protein deacylase [Planctomycetota bacterium]|nr:NAD-dependent protein deacylase [Planctomycetota bacterium]